MDKRGWAPPEPSIDAVEVQRGLTMIASTLTNISEWAEGMRSLGFEKLVSDGLISGMQMDPAGAGAVAKDFGRLLTEVQRVSGDASVPADVLADKLLELYIEPIREHRRYVAHREELQVR